MMNIALSAANPSDSSPQDVTRVVHAAREFEAILLDSVLGPLEHSFASLPGGDRTSDSDSYRSLAMQTLATNLAARGGLGIADLITRNLLKTKV